MIDVCQWRANIGLWNYGQAQAASSRPAKFNGLRHGSLSAFKAAVDNKSGSTTSGSTSGDMAKLPVPLSLNTFLLFLSLYLSIHSDTLMIPPGNCVQCTTGALTDTNYLHSSLVLPRGSTSILIYNGLYYLIVCLCMLLLLSGDVECNPGPTIDDRPEISLLIQWLEPLVDWQSFACCLPGITQHDVSIIEAENSTVNDRKRKLYSKWDSVYSEATWKDVITALRIRRENTLAQNIKKMIEASVPNISNGAFVSTKQKQEIKFSTKEDEEEISHSLIELKKTFTDLDMEVRIAFDEKEASDPKLLINITRWIETYMNWSDKLTNASLNEAFKIIHPYYDFIDCNLIVDLSEKFLRGVTFGENELNIVSELQNHKKKADAFRSSSNVALLHKSLKNIYQEHIPDLANMPHVIIHLHNPWYGSNLNSLGLLIKHLLPVGLVQSLLKHITILSGSVVIKYTVLDSTADNLIEYTGGKLQFMRLIGIFSLYINDHHILRDDENMNFTFDLALFEAVIAGNNEAVEFLLQLETVNIDHTNEEGETVLMLACERGHKDIVHSLLLARASVNIQDYNGWTALIMASEYNHISIIHMLLQANANPHLKTSDESNALMIASYHGNKEVVELLIHKGVDYKYQQEDGWNAVMLACENGHTQIVELLLKKQVDPNVRNNDGWNTFMLACQKGHTQIVELLLKEQVEPNVQDAGNAFMLACRNDNIQIIELLLKEQVVDPNIQDRKGNTALMIASAKGHYEVVKLLLEWKADPTIKANKGHTALEVAKTIEISVLLNRYLRKHIEPKKYATITSYQCQICGKYFGGPIFSSTILKCLECQQKEKAKEESFKAKAEKEEKEALFRIEVAKARQEDIQEDIAQLTYLMEGKQEKETELEAQTDMTDALKATQEIKRAEIDKKLQSFIGELENVKRIRYHEKMCDIKNFEQDEDREVMGIEAKKLALEKDIMRAEKEEPLELKVRSNEELVAFEEHMKKKYLAVTLVEEERKRKLIDLEAEKAEEPDMVLKIKHELAKKQLQSKLEKEKVLHEAEIRKEHDLSAVIRAMKEKIAQVEKATMLEKELQLKKELITADNAKARLEQEKEIQMAKEMLKKQAEIEYLDDIKKKEMVGKEIMKVEAISQKLLDIEASSTVCRMEDKRMSYKMREEFLSLDISSKLDSGNEEEDSEESQQKEPEAIKYELHFDPKFDAMF